MFGNLGQLAQLLRNAGQIKDGLKDMQARMAAARFTGEAGGGQVRATVDGKGEIQSITIDPELVRAGDIGVVAWLAPRVGHHLALQPARQQRMHAARGEGGAQ